jgi:hypothetical protein
MMNIEFDNVGARRSDLGDAVLEIGVTEMVRRLNFTVVWRILWATVDP